MTSHAGQRAQVGELAAISGPRITGAGVQENQPGKQVISRTITGRADDSARPV